MEVGFPRSVCRVVGAEERPRGAPEDGGTEQCQRPSHPEGQRECLKEGILSGVVDVSHTMRTEHCPLESATSKSVVATVRRVTRRMEGQSKNP